MEAVYRLADEVEIDNRIGEGTCIVARKYAAPTTSRSCEVAIMSHPFPGEAISGDDAVCFQSETGFLAAVSDGLGHGPEARDASNHPVDALGRMRESDLDQIAIDLDRMLADTRGCAMSIVRFNMQLCSLESISVGDVHAHVYYRRDAHFFTATPLVLGTGRIPKQRVRVEKITVEPDSVLVMFTDGLKSQTSLKGQLDVLRKRPAEIAQHLLEHDSRPDDDALVLVARFLR